LSGGSNNGGSPRRREVGASGAVHLRVESEMSLGLEFRFNLRVRFMTSGFGFGLGFDFDEILFVV
jgi:hypothetical protein